LHGGGQNARTWDLVLLLLGRPAVAIDLPGHGHSSWRPDRDYGPMRNAAAVAATIEQQAAQADAVIGMSLGGLTLIHMAATRPDLVRRAMLVDVTPGSPQAAAAMSGHQRGAVQLTRGPRAFASRQEMIDAAVAGSPRRPASAVRRGVIHNSRQLPDRTWVWRYDRSDPDLPFPAAQLWDDLARLPMPAMLVTGAESGFVTDSDKAEVRRRLSSIRVEGVPAAGHAVQSDQPAALAALIADFVPPSSFG
jgi:esterase